LRENMNKNYVMMWVAIFILTAISIFNIYGYYSLNEKIHGISGKFYILNTSSNTTEKRTNESILFPVERSIPIVAVSSDGEGVVGNLIVKLIPGNNNVLINTNPFLETDIQYSANKAVAVAKLRSNYNYDKDFILDFKAGDARLIGGESAGAAIAIATIAALENKPLKNEAVITGTINPDGTIGRVGGIIEKAKAVADAGYRYFLVPKGQSVVTYYERQLVREPFGFGFEILNMRYVPKRVDLKKIAKEEWGLNIVEVSTIEEALPYFIGD